MPFAGCSSGGGPPSPSPVRTAVATAAPAVAVKAPLSGLVAMGSLAFAGTAGAIPDNGLEEIAAHPNVYAGTVINVTWAQLEPQAGVFDDGAISAALANVAAYDATHAAHPVAAKLRIYAGANVPAWVVQLTGGPITVSTSRGTAQIAAFWTSAYDTAWRALQAHLAGEYDTSPAIAEVAVSSCSSRTAEPFIISFDAASLTAMRAFGFSDSTYRACLANAASDYAVWKNTPLDYTFNTFVDTDGASPVADPTFTISVMQSWRGALGGRAIVANHGLQSPLAAGAMPIYAELLTLGPPMEFQGISPAIDWDASIALAMTYHPSEIEIWPTTAAGGSADISQTQLQTWAAEF